MMLQSPEFIQMPDSKLQEEGREVEKGGGRGLFGRKYEDKITGQQRGSGKRRGAGGTEQRSGVQAGDGELPPNRRREEMGMKGTEVAEERRKAKGTRGCWDRGLEEKQGPWFRNQTPGGRSRCRLQARPLGLKGLPELKTICTASFFNLVV